MEIITPLSKDDIRPYAQQALTVGVRIHKKGIWFAGFLSYFSISPYCILRVESITRYKPRIIDLNAKDYTQKLIDKDDVPISGSFSGRALPFTLDDPEKVSSDLIPKGMLVIQFKDGAAILSVNNNDIEDITALLLSSSKLS